MYATDDISVSSFVVMVTPLQNIVLFHQISVNLVKLAFRHCCKNLKIWKYQFLISGVQLLHPKVYQQPMLQCRIQSKLLKPQYVHAMHLVSYGL